MFSKSCQICFAAENVRENNNWCQEFDSGIRTANNRAAFDTLKLPTRRQQTKTKFIEKAVKKNSNNSLKDWRKLLVTLWKFAPTIASSTASSQTIYQHMHEWENAGRSGPVQVPGIHRNHRRNTPIKEVKTRLAQAYSAMTRLAILRKTTPSVFLQRLNSTSQSLARSILLHGCESWTLMGDTERRIQPARPPFRG